MNLPKGQDWQVGVAQKEVLTRGIGCRHRSGHTVTPRRSQSSVLAEPLALKVLTSSRLPPQHSLQGEARSTYLPHYHPIRCSGTRNRYISMTTVRGVWGVGMGCSGCPWVSEAYRQCGPVQRGPKSGTGAERIRGYGDLVPSNHAWEDQPTSCPMDPPAHWVKPVRPTTRCTVMGLRGFTPIS